MTAEHPIRPAPPAGDSREEAVVAIEQALTRLRRNMRRRTLSRWCIKEFGLQLEVSHIDVIATVEQGGDMPDGEVTVGSIAERLNVDPSRASRIVAETVRHGLVRRVASQADARRISLELTEAGESLAARLHEEKVRLYGALVADWSGEDVRRFARLLDRFVGSSDLAFRGLAAPDAGANGEPVEGAGT